MNGLLERLIQRERRVPYLGILKSGLLTADRVGPHRERGYPVASTRIGVDLTRAACRLQNGGDRGVWNGGSGGICYDPLNRRCLSHQHQREQKPDSDAPQMDHCTSVSGTTSVRAERSMRALPLVVARDR